MNGWMKGLAGHLTNNTTIVKEGGTFGGRRRGLFRGNIFFSFFLGGEGKGWSGIAPFCCRVSGSVSIYGSIDTFSFLSQLYEDNCIVDTTNKIPFST